MMNKRTKETMDTTTMTMTSIVFVSLFDVLQGRNSEDAVTTHTVQDTAVHDCLVHCYYDQNLNAV